MGNEQVEVYRPGSMTAPLDPREIQGRRDRIVQVMQGAMRDGVDYGKIPGTPKPGLWQPGAEKLAAMFGIAVLPVGKPTIERDGKEYTIWTHLEAYVRLSDGLERKIAERTGVASSMESKWKWKRTYDQQLYDETPADEKRTIEKQVRGEKYAVLQIRQSPADNLNTLVQMSHKRAFVPLVREVTGASDVFSDPEAPPGDVEEQGEPGQQGRKAATRRSGPKQDAPKEDPPKEDKPAPAAAEPWPYQDRAMPVLDLKENPEKKGQFAFHLSPEDVFLTKDEAIVAVARQAAAEPDVLGLKVTGVRAHGGAWKALKAELAPLVPAPAASV